MTKKTVTLYYKIIIFSISFVSLTAYCGVPLLSPQKVVTDVVAPDDENIKTPPRTFAVGFQAGLLGPVGFELNLRIKSRLSLIPGYGTVVIDESNGNISLFKEDTNMCLLLRYGRSVYAGAGYIAMKKRRSERLDDILLSAESKSSGIPFFVGFEWASRKGNFLRGEMGAIQYIQRDETMVYASGPLQFTLEAPGSSTFSGLTIGRYLK